MLIQLQHHSPPSLLMKSSPTSPSRRSSPSPSPRPSSCCATNYTRTPSPPLQTQSQTHVLTHSHTNSGLHPPPLLRHPPPPRLPRRFRLRVHAEELPNPAYPGNQSSALRALPALPVPANGARRSEDEDTDTPFCSARGILARQSGFR